MMDGGFMNIYQANIEHPTSNAERRMNKGYIHDF